ncbi:MAG: hypothetical protein GY727_01035 [Gammaproteobacteria bacterium]|nr:hypothetical protein [Gammaproteobacteria bacterium]MCP4089792.1 hypothetical protein [Gammaproteobacteria bacterium]MCP4278191.1 hypothetical protein [Gammaproteobacteria bacterium]MCP4831910.1 hypothetical protein [Gammaproteobacteria bacterium]MCP4927618.1 hypothetical protein [Gammaproteobacteria bacterium]
MNNSIEASTALPHTDLIRDRTQGKLHTLILYVIAIPSFLLAGLCFQWYAETSKVALLLLGWVTFGMAFDFLGHIVGLHFSQHSAFLRWFARINYSALCFGIPFTALAGTFVLAEIVTDGISASLVNYYPVVLYSSLLFGSLFIFAHYRKVTINGAVEFVLDKSNHFTGLIFLTRRLLLALSLIIGITVMVDGFGTEWSLWAFAFGLSFIATVPLHIMHKQIPSMLSELITQVIAIYGTWAVFVS